MAWPATRGTRTHASIVSSRTSSSAPLSRRSRCPVVVAGGRGVTVLTPQVMPLFYRSAAACRLADAKVGDQIVREVDADARRCRQGEGAVYHRQAHLGERTAQR